MPRQLFEFRKLISRLAIVTGIEAVYLRCRRQRTVGRFDVDRIRDQQDHTGRNGGLNRIVTETFSSPLPMS